jgi:hypothetical protein
LSDVIDVQDVSIQSLKRQIEFKVKMRDLLRVRKLATIDQAYVIIETFLIKEKMIYQKADLHLLFQVNHRQTDT